MLLANNRQNAIGGGRWVAVGIVDRLSMPTSYRRDMKLIDGFHVDHRNSSVQGLLGAGLTRCRAYSV